MQFTTILFALLPVLAAAADANPVTDKLCAEQSRLTCPSSSDGVQRCLNLGPTGDLCVIDCQSQSVCRTQCKQQGHVNGFCTVGKFPCVCSDVDGGSGK
ncbi:hypothetical protein LY78DRAFT_709463 [Colletotrichum sublineola]|uniref:Putative biotrophy-associated secreted protein 3 n=1 Tax=Colletotrichum sublineola TaxID=1173701 RepID=A0A066XGZ6_COLSU|nr:hypothetical protein LY78DRAFT_709463 [Colletotrichum sublineola]KDN65280.1 putative biotrophy-associated secreted protein 3 [Colletotrichum sublineola]